MILAQAILKAAIDLRNKQEEVDEMDLEKLIDNIVKGGISNDFHQSEILQQFQREEDGRTYNNANMKYLLPSDKPEWIRLDKQHVMTCLGLGGLYPHPQAVEALLQPEDGVSKDILDMGCGTGLWSFEMCQKFPHSKVTGLDLLPIPVEPKNFPPNFKMEIADMSSDLHRFQNQFDLVHMRYVFASITDLRKTLREAQECLKPGGMLIAIAPDARSLDVDQTTLLPMATDEIPEGSWHQRLLRELVYADGVNGTDNNGLEELMAAGWWTDDLMEPSTCGTGSLFLPTCPWASSPDSEEDIRLKLIGTLLRENYISMHHAWKPVLKRSGLKIDEITDWAARADAELNTKRFPSWVRVKLVWGRRRATPTQQAVPNGVQHTYKSEPIQLLTDRSVTTPEASQQEPNGAQKPRVSSIFRIEVHQTKAESLERIRRIVDNNPPITRRLDSQPQSDIISKLSV